MSVTVTDYFLVDIDVYTSSFIDHSVVLIYEELLAAFVTRELKCYQWKYCFILNVELSIAIKWTMLAM